MDQAEGRAHSAGEQALQHWVSALQPPGQLDHRVTVAIAFKGKVIYVGSTGSRAQPVTEAMNRRALDFANQRGDEGLARVEGTTARMWHEPFEGGFICYGDIQIGVASSHAGASHLLVMARCKDALECIEASVEG